MEDIERELESNFNSKLLLKRAQMHFKNQNLIQAIQDAQTAFSLDKSPEALDMLKEFVVKLNDSETLESIKELLSTISSTNTAFDSTTSSADAILTEKEVENSKRFFKICSNPSHSETLIGLLKSTNLKRILTNEMNFQGVGNLICNYANQSDFELQKIDFLLQEIYKCYSTNSKTTLKCLLIALCREEIVLHFFDNIRFSLDLFSNSDRPIVIALLSSCFSKLETRKDKILSAIYELVLFLMQDRKVEALNVLRAVLDADTNYGTSVLLKDGLLTKIISGVESESAVYQETCLFVFASACNSTDTRKHLAPLIWRYLSMIWKDGSTKTRLLATVVLIKISPESKEALELVMHDSWYLDEFCDGLDCDLGEYCLESLVYLSLYPEMKKNITEHDLLLTKLKQFVVSGDKASLYATATTLANLVAFEKPLTEEEAQVRKLHQMAKSLPESNPLNNADNVKKRIDIIVKYGFVPLISKVKTSRANIMNSISEVIVSVATEVKYRGLLVQCGILPFLIKASLDLGPKNILTPSHALAKILISTNPTLAFKGEMASETIRPLVMLLTLSKSGLCQFEALLALTNIAGIDDTIRYRILQFQILPVIEDLQFSENALIKRASTELLCNLIYHPMVFEKYLDPKSGPGLQILTALSDDDDVGTRRAASGALAVLSSEPTSIKLLFSQKRFFEILVGLLESNNLELIHRASEIVKNIFRSGKENSSALPIDIIDLIQELSASENQAISKCNQESVRYASDMGLLII